ncbi:MAG: helix-turn-helix transcriptional regulator [Turicibacter sp.]|nr:helix-turn-helix transcriptional regulator [Turicibacter sp.]
MDKHAIDLLCEEYGVTRYALNKGLGLSQNMLNTFIIRGKSCLELKLKVILAIAQYLEIEPGELISKLKNYELNQAN